MKNWLRKMFQETDTELDASYIEGKDVFLPAYCDQSNWIRNKVFVGCRIRRPVVVMATGESSFESCDFDGAVELIFWDTGEPKALVGGIGIDNCIFRKCEFIGVGVDGTTLTIKRLKNEVEDQA